MVPRVEWVYTVNPTKYHRFNAMFSVQQLDALLVVQQLVVALLVVQQLVVALKVVR